MYGNDLVAGALMDVPIKFRALKHISSAGHVRPTSQDYLRSQRVVFPSATFTAYRHFPINCPRDEDEGGRPWLRPGNAINVCIWPRHVIVLVGDTDRAEDREREEQHRPDIAACHSCCRVPLSATDHYCIPSHFNSIEPMSACLSSVVVAACRPWICSCSHNTNSLSDIQRQRTLFLVVDGGVTVNVYME